MRRDDHVVELEQRALVRLLRVDVDRGRSELAGAQRLDQRLLVDELAPRGVDHPRAVGQLGDRVAPEEAARLGRERQVQGQELRRREHLVRALDALDAELAEALLGDERVVGDDAHPEAERAPGDLLADAAEAEHAERLALELDPAPGRALPAALLQRRVRLRDVAGERDQQADGVLRGRGDGRLGRVGDDDPAAGGRLDVDVVHPHSGAADHLQAVGALDQLGGQLRRRADHDRVVVADRLGEVAVAVDVDLEALAQEVDARLGDRLADEDPHTGVCSKASSARVTATPRSISAPSSTSPSSTAASAVVMSKTS